MIGVLGATGAIGQQVCHRLLAWHGGPLRVGSRHISDDVSFGFTNVHHQQVNIEDDNSLSHFMMGCDLVLNCAGPSHRLTPLVLQAAQHACIPYIDAGGAACARLPLQQNNLALVRLDAGAVPGLSGLLPRWLAQSFNSVQRLRVWHGIVDHFTLSGAEDFLIGVPSGGVKHASQPPTTLPFFPRPVIVEPYHNAETVAVGQALGLASHQQSWFNVSEDANLVRAREQLHQLAPSLAVQTLCQAAQLDCLRYRPYVRYLIELEGTKNSKTVTQTFLVSANSIAEASGSLMAALALDILDSPTSNSALQQMHAAQHRLSPTLFDALFSPSSGITCQEMDGPLEGFMDTQGGAL